MRYLLDGIKKYLILRKPLSGCLEGRTMLVPAAPPKGSEALRLHRWPARLRLPVPGAWSCVSPLLSGGRDDRGSSAARASAPGRAPGPTVWRIADLRGGSR